LLYNMYIIKSTNFYHILHSDYSAKWQFDHQETTTGSKAIPAVLFVERINWG